MVQEKAAQIRNAQLKAQQSQKRARIIMVAIACLLVVGICIAIVISGIQKSKAGNTQSTVNYGKYEQGAPVVVGVNGVTIEKTGKPVVTLYFDYICPHCLVIDQLIGKELFEMAHAGKLEIHMQPVATATNEGMSWGSTAAGASLTVAKNDPEHWEKFHDAITHWSYANFNTLTPNGENNSDYAKQMEILRQLAKQAGVKEQALKEVPQSFGVEYLSKSSANWVAWAKSHNASDNLGTPMLAGTDKSYPELMMKQGETPQTYLERFKQDLEKIIK